MDWTSSSMKTDTVSRHTVILVHALMAVLFVAFMVWVVLAQRSEFDITRLGVLVFLFMLSFIIIVIA